MSLQKFRIIFFVLIMSGVAMAAGPGDAVLGMKLAPISETRDVFKGLGVSMPTSGMVAVDIAIKSPADLAGIRKLDVIIIRNGTKVISTLDDYLAWAQTLKMGHSIKASVMHMEATGSHNGITHYVWKRRGVLLLPETREKMDEDMLRGSFVKIDQKWIELPAEIRSPSEEPSALQKLAVGNMGTIRNCRVVQVLGDSDAIFRLDDFDGASLRITHLSTTNMADDQVYRFDEPIAIVGTWKYGTVVGASRTILVGIPYSEIHKGLSDEELADLKAWLKKKG